LSLVNCLRAGSLVGLKWWLPTEPFDYSWGRFGCNQLRCGACKQPVQATIDEAKHCRHYACACQSRDEYSYHILGEDAGHIHEFVTEWYCSGHPVLPLPVVLDGIEIAAVSPFASIVTATLATPPFVAPTYRTPSFWVQRLFRLLPAAAQQDAVARAVARHLASQDARTARAAIDFFLDLPWAAGATEVATVASLDRDRLRATLDPLSLTKASLYERIMEAVGARLAVREGGTVDAAALDVACRALLAGEAGSILVYSVAASDPAWFTSHAAAIARARPADIDFVLEALKDFPEQARSQVIQEIRALSKAADKATRSWLKENPEFDPSLRR
jgi:hypothetical protein